jgi:hypothetical protein
VLASDLAGLGNHLIGVQTIKQALRQFVLRGMEKVKAEWVLIGSAHDLTGLTTLYG